MNDRFRVKVVALALKLVARFRARFRLTNPFVFLKVFSSKRHFVECVQWVIYYRDQTRFSVHLYMLGPETQDLKARVLTPVGRADI